MQAGFKEPKSARLAGYPPARRHVAGPGRQYTNPGVLPQAAPVPPLGVVRPVPENAPFREKKTRREARERRSMASQFSIVK
jgi:hypothetical protein